MTHYGTVTFNFEGTEDEVQEYTERIIKAVEGLCDDIPFNLTEDAWDDENA